MNENIPHPIILVFYLDRDMMANAKIMGHYVNSVNKMIEIKKLNMIALFIPTDGEEKIECINPVIASEEQMSNISKIIKDIETNFSVGTNEIKN